MGDPDPAYPGYPKWQERAILTLTNAVRMAPVPYKNKFLGDYKILLPSNYPAVPPLYWHIDLNRAARLHSNNMANNCGLQHNSCDGSDAGARIRSFYKDGYGWGENIAYYFFSPRQTLHQWLLDGNKEGVPAPDLSKPDNNWRSGDGHRANIMNPKFHLLGVGYALGPINGSQWRPEVPYWTQDFGSEKNGGPSFAIPSGSHLFLNNKENQPFEADSLTFAANFFQRNSSELQIAVAVVDGKRHNLAPWLNNGINGTYAVNLPKATHCRPYFFQFQSADGRKWRYPEKGSLLTFGEGQCETDYTTQMVALQSGLHPQKRGIKVRAESGKLIISSNNIAGSGNYRLILTDLAGRVLIHKRYIELCEYEVEIQPDSGLAQGVYIVTIRSIAGSDISFENLLIITN